MTHKEQLALWVEGKSVHNDDLDECCPDFSCCQPQLLAPLDVRQRFFKAHNENDEPLILEILRFFLGAAFGDENIYVAGSEANQTKAQ